MEKGHTASQGESRLSYVCVKTLPEPSLNPRLLPTSLPHLQVPSPRTTRPASGTRSRPTNHIPPHHVPGTFPHSVDPRAPDTHDHAVRPSPSPNKSRALVGPSVVIGVGHDFPFLLLS